MRFGILLLAARYPGQDDTAALTRTIEAALAAEDAGFDDVWLAGHHFTSYGVVPSAATLAGHLLGRTRRIDVGTAVSVLSSRHPVALAEEAALLATASGVDGRPRERRDPAAYTRHLCDLHPVGSPDDCAGALLESVRRTGIRHFVLLVEAAGSHAATLENIARLGARVLPKVRAGAA